MQIHMQMTHNERVAFDTNSKWLRRFCRLEGVQCPETFEGLLVEMLRNAVEEEIAETLTMAGPAEIVAIYTNLRFGWRQRQALINAMSGEDPDGDIGSRPGNLDAFFRLAVEMGVIKLEDA